MQPVSTQPPRRDEIVDEVRRVREEHAARFGFDLDRIVEDLKSQERRSRNVVVREPKRARDVRGAA